MVRPEKRGSKMYEATAVMNTLRVIRMERRAMTSNEGKESEREILMESGAEGVNAGELITTGERGLIERMMAI